MEQRTFSQYGIFNVNRVKKVLHYWLWMQEMVLLFIWDKEGYNKR